MLIKVKPFMALTLGKHKAPLFVLPSSGLPVKKKTGRPDQLGYGRIEQYRESEHRGKSYKTNCASVLYVNNFENLSYCLCFH